MLPFCYVWSFLVNLSPVYFIKYIYVKENLRRSREGEGFIVIRFKFVVRVITTDKKKMHIGNLFETGSKGIGHEVMRLVNTEQELC